MSVYEHISEMGFVVKYSDYEGLHSRYDDQEDEIAELKDMIVKMDSIIRAMENGHLQVEAELLDYKRAVKAWSDDCKRLDRIIEEQQQVNNDKDREIALLKRDIDDLREGNAKLKYQQSLHMNIHNHIVDGYKKKMEELPNFLQVVENWYDECERLNRIIEAKDNECQFNARLAERYLDNICVLTKELKKYTS